MVINFLTFCCINLNSYHTATGTNLAYEESHFEKDIGLGDPDHWISFIFLDQSVNPDSLTLFRIRIQPKHGCHNFCLTFALYI